MKDKNANPKPNHELDILLCYEKGLLDCGLIPKDVDYDKLSEHRMRYAAKLKNLSKDSTKEEV